jgi:hypothetical protein
MQIPSAARLFFSAAYAAMILSIGWVSTCVTVCHYGAAYGFRVKCKSQIFGVVSEVPAVRAGYWQVIDVLAIVAEHGFRPYNGPSVGWFPDQRQIGMFLNLQYANGVPGSG